MIDRDSRFAEIQFVRRSVILAAILCGVAVAAGAFGAHALRERLEPRELEVWQTAVRYQFGHGLAVGLCAALGPHLHARLRRIAALAFFVGCIGFSGSLYVLALGGPRLFGPVTPLGGLSFLAGWVALAGAARRAAPARG